MPDRYFSSLEVVRGIKNKDSEMLGLPSLIMSFVRMACIQKLGMCDPA